ncbi:MAG: hypothetical protein V4755_07635, partial [Curtobacterium sp.]
MTELLSQRELRDWIDSQPVAGPLTEMTGRRKRDEATTYVGRIEVSQTKAIIGLLSAVLVGLPLAGLLMAILSVVGLFGQSWLILPVPALVGIGAVVLFSTRERRGLRLLRYQGILDRRR